MRFIKLLGGYNYKGYPDSVAELPDNQPEELKYYIGLLYFIDMCAHP